MNYYAVIDTNVIVSALLKEGSIPWQILDLVVEEKIIPVFNKEIMAEYEEVLIRNKFGFSPAKIKMTLSLIEDFGREMDPVEIQEKFIHEDDAKFFKIVMSSRILDETYLITGNIKHFPERDFVVTPAQMLEIINNN